MNKSEFSIHEFAIVSRSRKEVNEVLTLHGGYFFSPIELTNSDYISEILGGEKLVRIVSS